VDWGVILETFTSMDAGAEPTTSRDGGSAEIVWNDFGRGSIYGVSLKSLPNS